jgi:amidase
MPTINVEQSGAFIETFVVPPTGDGPLKGLRFGVKDLIDVAGYRTGCGNPMWRETHPAAAVSAVCVEQLLAAAAECVGKAITDELAFSLLGENYHYGTPLNPAAPDRVPGGSSCGSAAAVACGLVDFALGTDTGGSVRVPASNCGIWGWRPTYGAVSVAGVMPLAPTYDTVGILAANAEVMRKAASVLCGGKREGEAPAAPNEGKARREPRPPVETAAIIVVDDAFAIADAAVRDALRPVLEVVSQCCGGNLRRASLAELCRVDRAADLSTWRDTYRFLMGAEAISCLGSWLDAEQPVLGPMAAAGFKFARGVDRTRLGAIVERRERYCRQLQHTLTPRDLLCIPTAPSVAPRKGELSGDRNSDYYSRTLSLTAIAGVARLPQVTMPLAKADGAPIGLSLIGAHGEDAFVLDVAHAIAVQFAAS